jgi:DNA topoisomerase IA
MVCERYWEHKRFESKPFWQVHFGVVDTDSGNILKFTSANRWADKGTATEIRIEVSENQLSLTSGIGCYDNALTAVKQLADYLDLGKHTCIRFVAVLCLDLLYNSLF